MKDGIEMKGRKTCAVVVAVLMLMMVVQIPLSDVSDTSYAASGDTPSIGNVTISVFDQDSTDYSSVAYLSDQLPTQLNAAEWVYDADTKLWYNISSTSNNYGKTLKYGMITGISVSEIRSDIVNYLNTNQSAGFTTSFVMLQVDLTQTAAGNITLEIDKDGQSFDSMTYMSMDKGGFRILSSVQQSIPISVSATGLINPTDVKGDYTVTVKFNGASAGSASITYGGNAYTLQGKVVDAGGDSIPGAEVRYEVYADSTPSAALVAQGVKTTGSDGAYTIYAKQYEVARIISVSFEGLTFDAPTYEYGTILADAIPGPEFKSKEHLVTVTVEDASGRPAVNASLQVVWYTSVLEGTTYVKGTSDQGINDDAKTGADGKAMVVIDPSKMPAGAKLYVSGLSEGKYYSFDTDVEVSSSTYDLPDSLSHEGNTYVNTSTYDDVMIYAEEFSIEVNVLGALDSHSVGGAVLQNVKVDAEWLFQTGSGTDYKIRGADEQKDGNSFPGFNSGKAWLPNPYTDSEGKVVVCYAIPSWSGNAYNEAAYLYIMAGKNTQTATQFAFDATLPTDGSLGVPDYGSQYASAISLSSSISIPPTIDIMSIDVAYYIDGTITGTVPEKVNVICMNDAGGREIEAVADAGQIAFKFTIKAGTSNIIEIDDVEGYSFTNSRLSLPTASNHQTFSSIASLSVSEIDRAIPETIGTYEIDGVSAGDVIDFRYKVAGVEISTIMVAGSNTLTLEIKGWPGNDVTGFDAKGNGVYLSEFIFDGVKYVSDASKVIERKYVTYYNDVEDKPTIDNVVGMQTIQILCDGSLYTSAVTDQKGVATVSVPDVTALTYSFGGLTIVATPISGGAYDGFYAINLKDVIEPVGAKQVQITIRYIATSSLQNMELPTNVDVLNGPMDVILDVGLTQSFEAPSMDGFDFAGWYLNGESVSDPRNSHLCTFQVTDDMDGATLTASYSAVTPEPPKEDIGTIIAIGMVSVTIALIALIYVILQIRRY